MKKSDKLLKFTLDDGTGTDRVRSSPASGKYYEPEQLIGKTAGGHREPAAPEDDGPWPASGMLISAVHTEHGEEKLHLLHAGRRHPRRRQAVLRHHMIS